MLQQYIDIVKQNHESKKRILEKLKKRPPEHAHELEPVVFEYAEPVAESDSDSEHGRFLGFDMGSINEHRELQSTARLMERFNAGPPLFKDDRSNASEESNADPNAISSTDARDIAQYNLLSRGASLARGDAELLKLWKQQQDETQLPQDESTHKKFLDALNSTQTETEIHLFILAATEEKDRIVELLKQVADIASLLTPVKKLIKPANEVQSFIDLVEKNDATFNEIVRFIKNKHL